jgi:hypothetical protein
VKFNSLGIYPRRIFFQKCPTKRKNGQMGLHKIERTKEMVSKLKRPPTEWENYLLSIHQTKD